MKVDNFSTLHNFFQVGERKSNSKHKNKPNLFFY